MAEAGDSIPADLQNTDMAINAHGHKLAPLISGISTVLCTGRTAPDSPAQVSFKANSNTAPSCVDHFLMDQQLCPFNQTCQVGPPSLTSGPKHHTSSWTALPCCWDPLLLGKSTPGMKQSVFKFECASLATLEVKHAALLHRRRL